MSLLAPLVPYLLAALGAIGTGLALWFGGHRAGKASAQADALRGNLEAREKGDEAAARARGERVADRLRDGRF